MTAHQIQPPRGIPAYDDQVLYLSFGDRTLPWEFGGWKRESLSWKTGCYIHAGLSGYQLDIHGTQAEDFLKSLCVNDFGRFTVGKMRHAVMCTQEGLITSHAIIQRNAPQLFRAFAAGYPWLEYQASRTSFDVTIERVPGYLHQIAGPHSIHVLEAAAGEGLRDIKFLTFRAARIAGRDVEIGRIGMAGNLAYEVRGPMDDGPEVYAAILAHGVPFGIERLGWRTYFVNHVEGGFPQTGWTFFNAAIADPEFAAYVGRPAPLMTGSIDPANVRARFRTISEVGWSKTVKLDHDFLGRAAVEADLAAPKRGPATLRWNAEDVVDIYASLLRPGPEYKSIDMPATPSWRDGFFAHADAVMLGGREIGISSGTVYSYHFREVLSMATIDLEASAIGTEVIVHWGDHGGPIKHVRATVERYPYLAEGRNDQVNLMLAAPSASPRKIAPVIGHGIGD